MILRMLLLSLCLALPLGAQAQTWRYDHNGSVMEIRQAGAEVQISYLEPRQGLRDQGVQPGTLLFTGRLDRNGYLEGMARVFRRGCGVIDYFVYGDFAGGRPLHLSGAAPILARQGCQIVDNSHEVANANLRFTPLAANMQMPVLAPVRHGARFCVTNMRAGSSLNLRTGPGTTYTGLGSIPGASCDVFAAAPARGGWQPVEYGGQRGWAALQYLRPVN